MSSHRRDVSAADCTQKQLLQLGPLAGCPCITNIPASCDRVQRTDLERSECCRLSGGRRDNFAAIQCHIISSKQEQLSIHGQSTLCKAEAVLGDGELYLQLPRTSSCVSDSADPPAGYPSKLGSAAASMSVEAGWRRMLTAEPRGTHHPSSTEWKATAGHVSYSDRRVLTRAGLLLWSLHTQPSRSRAQAGTCLAWAAS